MRQMLLELLDNVGQLTIDVIALRMFVATVLACFIYLLSLIHI